MSNRVFHACKDHADVAFTTLMHGTFREQEEPLPGDRLIIDSKAGCGWC